MKKLLLNILVGLLLFCVRIDAAEDFCVKLDMNAFGYEAFRADEWETSGDVSIINQNEENLLEIGVNSYAIYTTETVRNNNRVVLTASVSAEQSGGFVGVYINNDSGKTCFSLAFNPKGEISAYTTGGWKTLCGYETGVMYDIRCVIDSENNSFSVSIDGVEYISGAPLRNKAGIKSIKIYTEKTKARMKNFSLYSGKVSKININSTKVYGGEQLASGRDEFEISFSEDMKPDTLNGGTIVLRSKSGADIPYRGEYIAQKRSFVLRPCGLYNARDGLILVVKGGDNGVMAADGSKINSSSYILDFDVINKAVEISEISVSKSNDGLKLSFSAENMCDIIKKQRVIIAAYSCGKLTDLRMYGIEEAPKALAYFEIEYTGAYEGNELYAYIFDLEDMIPVSERILLKSQEMSE